MKKIYNSPSTKVVKIGPMQMIAASDSVGVSSTNYNGSTTVESRRGGTWYYDDEEEE